MICATLFDFFDTLVEFRAENLPIVEFPDGYRRSTLRAVYESIGDGPNFTTFAHAIDALDHEFAVVLASGREISSVERFTELARRLRIDNNRGKHMARVHLSMITRVAVLPERHRSVLATLYEKKFPMRICSNFTDTKTLEYMLKHLSIYHYFESITVSEGVGWRKPRQEIFECAARGWRFEKKQILHVGNHVEEDVRGAREYGLSTAWLTRDPAVGVEADFVLPTLDNLLDILHV